MTKETEVNSNPEIENPKNFKEIIERLKSLDMKTKLQVLLLFGGGGAFVIYQIFTNDTLYSPILWKTLGSILILSILIGIYLIPITIAKDKNHSYKTAITILTILGGLSGILWMIDLIWYEVRNSFGGWSAILWIVALVWCYVDPKGNNIKEEK